MSDFELITLGLNYAAEVQFRIEFIIGLSFAVIVAAFVGKSLLTKTLYKVMAGIYSWLLVFQSLVFSELGGRHYLIVRQLIEKYQGRENEIPNVVINMMGSAFYQNDLFLKYASIITYVIPALLVTLWFIYYMGWVQEKKKVL